MAGQSVLCVIYYDLGRSQKQSYAALGVGKVKIRKKSRYCARDQLAGIRECPTPPWRKSVERYPSEIDRSSERLGRGSYRRLYNGLPVRCDRGRTDSSFAENRRTGCPSYGRISPDGMSGVRKSDRTRIRGAKAMPGPSFQQSRQWPYPSLA